MISCSGLLRTLTRKSRVVFVENGSEDVCLQHISLCRRSISTLINEPRPSHERLVTFHQYHRADEPKSLQYFRAFQNVSRDGVSLGQASITMKPGDWKVEDGELRLCPYFDPKSKSLKFKQPDGKDFPRVYHIRDILGHRNYRPLLQLAHAEKLLEKVPAGELSSLDFQTVLESGYCNRARLHLDHSYSPKTPSKKYEASFRFAGGLLARLKWSPADDNIREYVDCFPYIDGDNLLRIWDVERSRDVRALANAARLMPSSSAAGTSPASGTKRQRGRIIVDSYSAEQLKRRSKILFGLIQKMGYWKDL